MMPTYLDYINIYLDVIRLFIVGFFVISDKSEIDNEATAQNWLHS